MFNYKKPLLFFAQKKPRIPKELIDSVIKKLAINVSALSKNNLVYEGPLLAIVLYWRRVNDRFMLVPVSCFADARST